MDSPESFMGEQTEDQLVQSAAFLVETSRGAAVPGELRALARMQLRGHSGPDLQDAPIDFVSHFHSDIILTWHKSRKNVCNLRKLALQLQKCISTPWQNVLKCRKLTIKRHQEGDDYNLLPVGGQPNIS
jgi:hypothetical protein